MIVDWFPLNGAGGKQLTHPTSLESMLVMASVTFLKALLCTSTWAPIRVLMAELMLLRRGAWLVMSWRV